MLQKVLNTSLLIHTYVYTNRHKNKKLLNLLFNFAALDIPHL